ncbi:MAG: hypothetical protein R3F49_03650 [Planctomycetota bacterium]
MDIQEAHPQRRALRRALTATALVALALGAWSFLAQHGWPMADAVEYLERARAFVRGEPVIDAQAIRPMGVSLLFVPLFALAEALGTPDAAWLAPAARAIAVLLAAGTALAAAQLARRCTGAPLVVAVAGLVVATNPVLLRFAAVPLADVAATLGITLALLALTPRRGTAPGTARPLRHGLVVGAAASLACLSAYKTLPLVGVLAAAAVLGAAWRGRGLPGAPGARAARWRWGSRSRSASRRRRSAPSMPAPTAASAPGS